MLGWIGFVLLFAGVVTAVITGRGDDVTSALLSAPEDCIQLLLKIGGSICFFSGLMQVAQASGLVKKLSSFLARPLGWLMPGIRESEEVRSAVTLNLSSNFFGLGNAATPYGRKSSQLLYRGEIDRSLASFLILNTCSVQLIPTTVIALRQSTSAAAPADILPGVWIVQILSCSLGILLVRLLFRRKE